MFIYLLLLSCEGKYKERAKTVHGNKKSLSALWIIKFFFLAEKQKHYLPADGVRQIVRPVFEVDFLLRVIEQLLREGSVQVVIIAVTTQSLVWNLTWKKLSICTPKIRNQMSKGKTLTGNLMVNILLSLISNTLFNRVTTAFHTDDPRSTQTLVCRM